MRALTKWTSPLIVGAPDDEVEFATIMLFDSLEHVRAFAGEDYEAAYVPPRARAVLARFDGRSAHYETLRRPGEG